MFAINVYKAKRSPIGAFHGSFSKTSAPKIAGHVLQSVMRDIKLSEHGEVILGCVLQASLGQAPARQALIAANMGEHISAVTINKVCGSGMQAIFQACDILRLKRKDWLIAGGMENMTLSPYLLPNARLGYRLGHQKVVDHMFCDGLEDAYHTGTLMGCFADKTAEYYGFSREEQDEFAIESGQRAIANKELSKDEFASCPELDFDESLTKLKFDKIPQLKPAFNSNGTVTAANSSGIADGAAALLLGNNLPLEPIAKIIGYTSFAQAPEWFTTAPVGAMKKLLQELEWSTQNVDLWEINEAFAVVTMAAIKELQLDSTMVNVHGGACALGHPLGASGARIVVTLINALRARSLKRGIAALCIGSGEATALAIEMV